MAVYKPQIKTENGVVDLDIQAERSLKDGNGDTISTTYVKSVNNVTPDASGNVTINTSGTTPTLLWQNGNPNVQFAAQSVLLSESLSNFQYLIIEWGRDEGTNKLPMFTKFRILIGAREFLQMQMKTNLFDDRYTREFTITDATHITFHNGYYNGVQTNGAMLPIALYGTNDL